MIHSGHTHTPSHTLSVILLSCQQVSIYSISFLFIYFFAFWPSGLYQGCVHGPGCESTCCSISSSSVIADGFLHTPNPWLLLALQSEVRPDEALRSMTESSHSHAFLSVMSLPWDNASPSSSLSPTSYILSICSAVMSSELSTGDMGLLFKSEYSIVTFTRHLN